MGCRDEMQGMEIRDKMEHDSMRGRSRDDDAPRKGQKHHRNVHRVPERQHIRKDSS